MYMSKIALKQCQERPSSFSVAIQQFLLSFLCFWWMLRFKHSTYHSRFLRFIASTSGLKALHLTRSITLWHAFALLLSFLSVSLCCTFSISSPLFLPLFLHRLPSFTILLVNYLLYFVSELMSDIKRRMEPDSKIQKWLPLCCLRQ